MTAQVAIYISPLVVSAAVLVALLVELGEREMTRARAHGFPMWLVLLDLDHFALVNDLYGSDAGDEFALLLPHLTRQESEEVADRLRKAVEALAVWKDENLVTVTASVGLAGTGSTAHEFFNDLLAPADSALRRACEAGGNQVTAGELGWRPAAGAGPGRSLRPGGELGP